MDIHRTEDQQVEALRKWWNENGRQTIIVILLAVGGGFGWQGWQTSRQEQAEVASALYEDLLEAAEKTGSEEDLATARHLAETLKTDHSSTVYGQFAGLHLARMAVEADDLEAAEGELRKVLASRPPREMRLLTQLRLARVLAARGDAEAGLKVLDAAKPGAYASAYAEARGDMHWQLGRKPEAVSAYEEAASLAAEAGGVASQSLELKLQSLTPVPPRQMGDDDETPEPEMEIDGGALAPEPAPDPALDSETEADDE